MKIRILILLILLLTQISLSLEKNFKRNKSMNDEHEKVIEEVKNAKEEVEKKPRFSIELFIFE